MGIIKEYKNFINKGNVMDLAVGVIMGAAFGKVVNSLVEDVIMPPIGLFLGGVPFKDLKMVLKEATKQNAEVAIYYGKFLLNLTDFLIVAFCIFLVLKFLRKVK